MRKGTIANAYAPLPPYPKKKYCDAVCAEYPGGAIFIFNAILLIIIMDKELVGLIGKAKKDKDVLAVSIFGSFARGEKYRDVDVCLILRPQKYSNLEMSKKRLKYLSEAGDKFDIQIFQQLPVYIKHRILKEGKIIFCRDEEKLYDLALLTIKEYEDFKPIYRGYLEAVKHG